MQIIVRRAQKNGALQGASEVEAGTARMPCAWVTCALPSGRRPAKKSKREHEKEERHV